MTLHPGDRGHAPSSPTAVGRPTGSPPGHDPGRPTAGPAQVEAVIDLAAITANAALLRRYADGAALMAVVKADGYGHGAARSARAALAGGADMLGVATPDEAVALRRAGIDAPLAAWLWAPTTDIRPAVAAGIHLGVSSPEHLAAVTAASPLAPVRPVPIHLKVDTGLARNGATMDEFAALARVCADAERDGAVRVDGVMSHLASADVPGDPSVDAQITRFHRAVDMAAAAGLRPRWRHIANTAATLDLRAARLDLVRCGIGLYGLPPVAGHDGFVPAMTLRATVALTKRVPAGQGVGYGLTYRTVRDSTLALVPVGYGDGLPRAAGNVGRMAIGGRQYPIAGRVAMDQVVLDCGDGAVHAGDDVLLFGPGEHGEPTATDWADYCGTIDYEIVTRIGPRVPRRYVGG